MKAAVAHLIPAPFTQHVAAALHDGGHDTTFFTTLVDRPGGLWQGLARRAANLAGVDLGRELGRRAVTVLPAERVRDRPRRELLRMLQVKTLNDPVLGDRLFHWGRDGFDRWVATQLQGFDLLYGYEYASLAMFGRARELGVRTAYDLPSPEHDAVEALLAPEYDRFPSLVTPYRRHTGSLQAERTERRRQEWELADLVVANSRFTADTWTAAGWSPRRVAVVPYGAPPPLDAPVPVPLDGPLRLLWAGTFSIRKGAHLLLEAVEGLGLGPQRLQIDVYGAQGLPAERVAAAPAAVRFHGSIPRPELLRRMQAAHALIFPTLCDGFGLVVNEAFSQGLPVVTTRRAGAADLVREGQNGWLIEAGDAGAIAAAIERLEADREGLVAMRPEALRTAAGWQWHDYRRCIREVLEQAVATSGPGPLPLQP
ncbi:MAG: glycosyltransferase [Cyanobacteriota bacterium]